MISKIKSLKNLDNVLKYLEENKKRTISLEELQKASESYLDKIEVAMIMDKLEGDNYIDVNRTPINCKQGLITEHGMYYDIRINYKGLTFRGYTKQAKSECMKEWHQHIKDWILIIATCLAATYGVIEAYSFLFHPQ